MHPNRDGWFSDGNVPCDPVPPLSKRPLRMVLMGPPGVGKGTQATRICKSFRTCHLATGDLFRNAQCEGPATPAMKAALAAMQQGRLVPDDVVIEMVRERSGCLKCQGGCLLDGFPRTVRQAEALDQMLDEFGAHLDAVIAFEMAIEAIVARLGGRRTCRSCRAVFHETSNPPATPGICDQCGGNLVRREDDTPEAIRTRMEVYDHESRPLMEYYDAGGRLLRVTADGSPQEVFNRTIGCLSSFLVPSDAQRAPNHVAR